MVSPISVLAQLADPAKIGTIDASINFSHRTSTCHGPVKLRIQILGSIVQGPGIQIQVDDSLLLLMNLAQDFVRGLLKLRLVSIRMVII